MGTKSVKIVLELLSPSVQRMLVRIPSNLLCLEVGLSLTADRPPVPDDVIVIPRLTVLPE